jgi:hypothetical protein
MNIRIGRSGRRASPIDTLRRWLRPEVRPEVRPSRLLLLPVELLLLIVEHLDYASIICLKLSCKQLYEIIPMLTPPPFFGDDQLLALLRLIPPPVQRGLMPFILCEDCRKYHSPDTFFAPDGGYGADAGPGEKYFELRHANSIRCLGRGRGPTWVSQWELMMSFPVKPCTSCWAFGQRVGVQMPCACRKFVYVLVTPVKFQSRWERWRWKRKRRYWFSRWPHG